MAFSASIFMKLGITLAIVCRNLPYRNISKSDETRRKYRQNCVCVCICVCVCMYVYIYICMYIHTHTHTHTHTQVVSEGNTLGGGSMDCSE